MNPNVLNKQEFNNSNSTEWNISNREIWINCVVINIRESKLQFNQR